MARKTKVINFAPDKVKQPSGLKRDGTPNVYWKRFEKRLKEYNTVPPLHWSEEQILGYLLDRYSKHYGIDFSLSYSGAPTKCSEMYCVRRMITTLGDVNGQIAKDYIDWVFDTIIVPKKMQITSLAFFFTRDICNRFKASFKKNNTITRSTNLPSQYLDILSNMEIDVQTYGDLAFVKMARDQNPVEEYINLFKKLQAAGFDESLLSNLEQ